MKFKRKNSPTTNNQGLYFMYGSLVDKMRLHVIALVLLSDRQTGNRLINIDFYPNSLNACFYIFF